MKFNANFNNISVISWRSVLLMEKTASHGQTLMLYRVHIAMSTTVGFELTNLNGDRN